MTKDEIDEKLVEMGIEFGEVIKGLQEGSPPSDKLLDMAKSIDEDFLNEFTLFVDDNLNFEISAEFVKEFLDYYYRKDN